MILPALPLPRKKGALPAMMLRVLLALAPVAGLSVVVYGLPALSVILLSITGTVMAEVLVKWAVGNRQRLLDGSATISGILLALTLPPGLAPAWVLAGAFCGGLIGKQLFGGIGRNPLNPAMTGRLLLALFAGGAMERGLLQPFWWKSSSLLSWPGSGVTGHPSPAGIVGEASRLLGQALSGGVQSPLPRGWPSGSDPVAVVQHAQDLLDQFGPAGLIWPEYPGALGECSLLILLPGVALLLASRLVDWRMPLAALAAIAAGSLSAAGGPAETWVEAMLVVRGNAIVILLFIFAADPVTTPLTRLGKVIFGLLLGLLVAALLRFSDQAGALALALLCANLLTPWIDRITLSRGPRPVSA